VKLSSRLREQYPQEMTIVLQHQFWDLEVGDEAFEVGLSFSGIPERLRVPFDAITGFFDPSVEFGLQFATVVEDDDDDAPEAEVRPPVPVKAAERKPPAKPAAVPRAVPSPPPQDEEPDGDKPGGGAEVVRLDRFRKK